MSIVDMLRSVPSWTVNNKDFLALLGATVAFAIGLWQYTKAQRWRRAEFLAKAVKEMEDNPLFRRAMRILDFRESYIEPKTDWKIPFNDEILCDALPHEYLIPPVNSDQAEIRLAFCDFFDGIERLQHFLATKLYGPKLLAPYLPYWFRRFTTDQYKSMDFVYTIWTFIDGYEYSGVRALVGQLDCKGRFKRQAHWPFIFVYEPAFRPPKKSVARQKVIERMAAKVLRRLGIFFTRGQPFAETRACLEKAFSKNPDDAELLFVLGQALREFGENEKADQQFSEAQRLSPKFPTPKGRLPDSEFPCLLRQK